MNEILKKRIEEAADTEMSQYYNDDEYPCGIKDIKSDFKEAFKIGAEYALSHQFISVEEALPECSVMVFVKDKYGNYDTAYLSKKGYWIANDGKEIIVSFWMPIPKFELNKPE